MTRGSTALPPPWHYLLCSSAARTALGFFVGGFYDLYTSQFGVDHDTAAVFAYDDFFAHTNVELALGRDFVEATTTGITLYINDAQTIARIFANALEGCEQTGLDGLFKVLGLFAEFLFLSLSLGCDIVEFRLFHVKVGTTLLKLMLGIFNIGLAAVDGTLGFANLLVLKFNLKTLEFYFL